MFKIKRLIFVMSLLCNTMHLIKLKYEEILYVSPEPRIYEALTSDYNELLYLFGGRKLGFYSLMYLNDL